MESGENPQNSDSENSEGRVPDDSCLSENSMPKKKANSGLESSVGFVIDGVDVRNLDFEDLSSGDLPIDLPPSSQKDKPLANRAGRGSIPIGKGGFPFSDSLQFNADSRPATPALTDRDMLSQYYSTAFGPDRCFKIASNNMLQFPQFRFTYGVKYDGAMSLSQTVMLVILAAKLYAQRMGDREIGCEHVLLGLLHHHGFAAGQLLVGLHLNCIGHPFRLGDPIGIAKKAIAGKDGEATVYGVASMDMYFTREADEMMIEAIFLAAKAGQPLLYSKQVLAALLDFQNARVESALSALCITEKEIRDALSICPDVDDLRDYLLYFFAAVINSIIRIRLFQGPIRTYKQFARLNGETKN